MSKGWRKGQIKDEQGNRYGRLLVLDRAGYHVSSGGLPQAAWSCRCDCGNELVVQGAQLRSGHTRSCGCLRQDVRRQRVGLKNPNWKGGRAAAPSGYIHVRMREHPNNNNGYVLEHRAVMEAALNRLLDPDETVHHKNGDKTDNTLNNLEVWCNRHPKGQRVSDLIVWAKEILTKYAKELE